MMSSECFHEGVWRRVFERWQFERCASLFTGVESFMTEDAEGGLPWRKDYRVLHLFKRGAGSNKSIVMPDPESLAQEGRGMDLAVACRDKICSVSVGLDSSRMSQRWACWLHTVGHDNVKDVQRMRTVGD